MSDKKNSQSSLTEQEKRYLESMDARENERDSRREKLERDKEEKNKQR